MVGFYQAILFYLGHMVGHALFVMWSLVSLWFIVFWVELDCREQKDVHRPFEFGFLLLVSWPFYLPYYLFRTRGAYAILWLLGFVCLSLLGYVLEWCIYFLR